MDTGAIIGIVVGVVVFVIIMYCICGHLPNDRRTEVVYVEPRVPALVEFGTEFCSTLVPNTLRRKR